MGGEPSIDAAPVHYGSDEAHAWLAGYEVGREGRVDGSALVAYLEMWGGTMTTAKARWAAAWAAETVRKAMRDPSMLDRPSDA